MIYLLFCKKKMPMYYNKTMKSKVILGNFDQTLKCDNYKIYILYKSK